MKMRRRRIATTEINRKVMPCHLYKDSITPRGWRKIMFRHQNSIQVSTSIKTCRIPHLLEIISKWMIRVGQGPFQQAHLRHRPRKYQEIRKVGSWWCPSAKSKRKLLISKKRLSNNWKFRRWKKRKSTSTNSSKRTNQKKKVSTSSSSPISKVVTITIEA